MRRLDLIALDRLDKGGRSPVDAFKQIGKAVSIHKVRDAADPSEAIGLFKPRVDAAGRGEKTFKQLATWRLNEYTFVKMHRLVLACPMIAGRWDNEARG